MSFGITTRSSSELSFINLYLSSKLEPFRNSNSPNFSESFSKLCATITAASTTVGTPIAITGTPIVSFDISFLLLLTPAPGSIPVSEI